MKRDQFDLRRAVLTIRRARNERGRRILDASEKAVDGLRSGGDPSLYGILALPANHEHRPVVDAVLKERCVTMEEMTSWRLALEERNVTCNPQTPK